MSISEKRIFRSYGMITMGTFLMALGTCLIYEPMSMVTGGFSGVGIVLEKLFGIPVFAVTFLLNVPLFFMARKFHTREYLFRSLYAMITFSLALAVIPVTSVTHQDYLMAAILGGAFHGGGLGLVFLAGSSTGGTDLLSTLLHPLFPMMRLANIIGIVDGIIVVAGMLVFGVRTALYSIVAVFVTSKVMDGVTSGMRYAKIMYIISDRSAEIAEIILHQFERGVTALRGNGMYSGKEKQILMCVVSRREAVSMVKYVKEADERAFVIVADAREVLGKGFSIGN